MTKIPRYLLTGVKNITQIGAVPHSFYGMSNVHYWRLYCGY